MEKLVASLLNASASVRYVAIYHDGELTTQSRVDAAQASSAESDRYEEWLVNPAILTLAIQRGNIDCGGCKFVLIRYGNFFQLIRTIKSGHVSICIAPEADPLALGEELFQILDSAQA